MNDLTLGEFVRVVNGEPWGHLSSQSFVNNITIDSRGIQRDAIFFPFLGSNTDGHNFVSDAIDNGAVAAVVTRGWLEEHASLCVELPLVLVDNSLEAMHAIAAWWRKQFTGKVIGITGSNGKTVVKDALVTLLSDRYRCEGSPDSFNSQIGVPLAITRMPRDIDFAVVETGISEIGEMERLERIIRPDYGILTNIGLAHISSFNGSRTLLAEEKSQLFSNLPVKGWLLAPNLSPFSDKGIAALGLECEILRFGEQNPLLPYIEEHHVTREGSHIVVRFPAGQATKRLKVFTPSREILSNLEISICAAWLLGLDADAIDRALSNYALGLSRQEIWRSPTGVTLINDTCSADPLSVVASLKTLSSLKNGARTFFVFSGLRELGTLDQEEHAHIGEVAAECGVDRLVLVGDRGANVIAEAFRKKVPKDAPEDIVIRARDSREVKERLVKELRWGDIVLVKGPRNTGIDRVAREIMEAMAPNRYYIDLRVIRNNVLQFQHVVGSRTRILAMVKALAYGSDAARLSVELQRIGVTDFGVSSADEGADLRRAGVGIGSNILVMMCSPDEAEKLVAHHLSAVVYSFDIVGPLAEAARKRGRDLDVHIEVDTGMGRLGVRPAQVGELVGRIIKEPFLRVTGLFTHFACSEDPEKDDFTRTQIERFERTRQTVRDMGLSNLTFHACSTSGSVRFPSARYDMVRIGLGMYGIYPSDAVRKGIQLDLAVSLVSKVIEIREPRLGDSVGYGGMYTVPDDHRRIGVVPIGYHDGVPWKLSCTGEVLVNGKKAPVLGRISMDSMMIDLTDHANIEEGVDVLIYGSYGGYSLRPEDVAGRAETIPYELLARLGPRVQRIYLGERERGLPNSQASKLSTNL
jgi:alanine racemase